MIKGFGFRIWKLYFNFHVRTFYSRFMLGIELRWFREWLLGKMMYSLDIEFMLGFFGVCFNMNFARGRAEVR